MTDYAAGSCLAFAEHSTQAIFCIDLELSALVYCNPVCRSLLCLDDSLISKNSIDQIIHIEDLEYVQECYKKMCSVEPRLTCKFRIVNPNDKVISVQVEATRTITYQERQVIVGTVEKIAALVNSNRSFDNPAEKNTDILNIISHDLLSPLGTIQNLAELINKKFTASGNQELGRLINSIERISRHSITLVRDLLAWEFAETSGAGLLLIKTDVVAILKEMVEKYQNADIPIKRNFSFLLPQNTIMVNIDPPKFLQVLENLLSNALKFTNENGNIHISLRERDKAVVVVISDDGIGIPKQHHATLFDKFTSARRPGLRGEPSHGIGMSIIRTIIERHYGKIWFDSKEGVGTTFYISLPRQL